MQPTPSGGEAAWAARTSPTIVVSRAGADSTASIATVEVLRELKGDLPEETSFVGGSASATATLSIDQPAVGTHPLHQPDAAAVLGQAVTVAAGFGGYTVPLFAGSARTWSADDAGMVQAVGAADGADLLTAPVTLPAFGSIGWGIPLPRRLRRWPTNSAAVIVAALHASGVRVTPALPPAPQYAPSIPASTGYVAAMPLVGGFLPDPGMGSVRPAGSGVAEGASWLSSGLFGPCPAASGAVSLRPAMATPWQDGQAIGVEAWVDCTPQAATRDLFQIVFAGGARIGLRVTSSNGCYVVGMSDGGLTLSQILTAPGFALPTSGWHRLVLRVSWGGSVLVGYDSITSTTSTLWSGSVARPAACETFEVQVWPDGHVQAVGVHYSGQGVAWAGSTTTPPAAGASVPAGALDLDVLPTITGRTAWDVIRSVAAAELGVVGFDEAGTFTFTPRAALNGVTTPVETIGTDVTDTVRSSVTLAGVRTRVTASLPRPFFVEHPGDTGDRAQAVTPSDVLTFPAGASEQLVTWSQPMIPTSSWVRQATSLSVIETAGASWDGAYVALCTDAGGASPWSGSGFRASLRPVSPTAAILRVTNPVTLYAVIPTSWASSVYGPRPGGPGLVIFGAALASADEAGAVQIDVRNATAAATWGERTYELPVSDWPGSPTSVQALATGLLADLAAPRALLDPITVPADPRRQLGDVVTLHDTAGVWPDRTARIVSIRTRLDLVVEGRMTQTLGLRALPTT